MPNIKVVRIQTNRFLCESLLLHRDVTVGEGEFLSHESYDWDEE